MLAEPCPQVLGPGDGEALARPWWPVGGLGWPGGRAVATAARAAVGHASSPPGLRGPRRAGHRVQRIGLALAAPVLPVRTVHLHHPDARGCHVPGQARAVAAGPFDADQGDGPEPAQPARGQAYPAAVAGNSRSPSSPPDRVKRCGDMQVSMGIHAAGDSTAVFYDGHAIPFLWLKGWHAPAGRRTREPRPLAQDGQITQARRWVPQKNWARPTNR